MALVNVWIHECFLVNCYNGNICYLKVECVSQLKMLCLIIFTVRLYLLQIYSVFFLNCFVIRQVSLSCRMQCTLLFFCLLHCFVYHYDAEIKITIMLMLEAYRICDFIFFEILRHCIFIWTGPAFLKLDFDFNSFSMIDFYFQLHFTGYNSVIVS